jgi:hypothetical protein
MNPPDAVGPNGRRTAMAVAVLCGITLAFYHGLWLPGLVLIKRDAFRTFPQLKQYVIERVLSGELPQWIPYEGLGRPLIGTATPAVFHPFTALHALLPSHDAYRISVLIACLLAALGAFALGRALNFSRTGSVVSGIALALSGYVVSLTDMLQYMYSICALPLFCAALEKALRESRAWTVAPAVVWATVFLNGDIQTGYYYGFVAVVWVAARASSAYRETGIRLAVAAGLAVLLSGIQLGPSWAVFQGSERAQSARFHEQSMHWSTHPLRLMTVLAAPTGDSSSAMETTGDFDDTNGKKSFGFLYFGMFFAESLYLGIPVVGLAILGAVTRRDLRMLALLGCLGLLLALGRFGGLYELFYRLVPLWSAFRYPEKLMGLVSFAVAMLAGAGFDALCAGRGRVTLWLVAAILCVSSGVLLRIDLAGRLLAEHAGAPASLTAELAGPAAQAFLLSGVAALGMWLIHTGVRRRHLDKTLALGALLALVTMDLARANLGAYHVGPAGAAAFTPPLADALQAREGPLAPGRFRMISIMEDVLVWPNDHMRTLGFWGATAVANRQALDLEHNVQFHLETVMPYLPGHSPRFAETLNSRSGIEAAARFNVSYYIGRRYHLKDPRLARGLVAELPPYDLALFRNPIPAKPRAYLSRQAERAAAPVDPMTLFTRPDFLDGTVDVIETATAPLPAATPGGSALIERYAPEKIRVRVETPQPAVLVLLDAYDQGWTASLEDGIALPILRANALVRAVVVPAGTHVVTFTYRTPLLTAGAWASLTGCLLCIGLIAHGLAIHRRAARLTP